MQYDIQLYHDKQLLDRVMLVGETILQELVEFIIENYSQIFKESYKPRMSVKSRHLNKYLNPQQDLRKILGNLKVDSFDLEIHQQSQINELNEQYIKQKNIGGNQSLQQNILVEQNQQNLNQSINQQKLILIFKYNQDQIQCELNSDTTLAEVNFYIQDHFKIQKQFNLVCNQVNLSEMSQQTKLNNLQLRDNMVIDVVSQKDKPSSNIVKIQFNIEDGMIKRSCVLYCNTNQKLGEIKTGVLFFLGITGQDIVDVDFYFGDIVMIGKKLNETLDKLQINKDNTTVKVKVRWIGG